MRLTKMGYIALAAVGLTLGAAFNASAVEEESSDKDQCYRKVSEAPGTCSVCKDENCQAGTYCCKITVLGPGEEEPALE